MGLFDKLKNVFFEESEEEVEEEKVARKIKSPEPIAKKEVLETLTIEEEKEELKEKEEEKFAVPFEDSDFEIEKTIEFEEPVKEVVTEKKEEPRILYGEEVKVEPKRRGLYEMEYEEKKSTFSPSPIISPIFGVLNKNYSKDEIVHRNEVRLSQTSNKKADIDRIREKVLVKPEEPKANFSVKPGIYDLNEESPTIKEITLGDAEEYFNDLGLEYNVDYKVEEEKSKDVEFKSRSEKNRNLSEEEDKNLFDLINSIYQGKE